MARVTRTALFPATQVAELLAVAERARSDVLLVKDQGAYLMTSTADGAGFQNSVVYAVGHEEPPRTSPANFGPDDPGVRARWDTAAVWGGDDFTESFTVAELRSVLGAHGIRAVVELDEEPWPAEYLRLPISPPTLCRRVGLALEPAGRPDAASASLADRGR